MGRFDDMFLLLLLASIIVAWLKLSRLREIATAEARRQCERHGLQLLDETVGLRNVRLRKLNGMRVFERCYAFEVSIDGDDREPGRLWMALGRLTGLSLPTIETRIPEHDGDAPETNNVVPLRPRLDGRKSGDTRLH
ncbi:DUF3301 domain-containing protein [Dyella sp. LX-66]|uniref:DUF3301 domain-containing protein n=1 Tax=unclassified Dyella TaxID=2634549 RepID=UPI001BE02E8A|nr:MULTISPECIES: DUF3301 domain-containing protein [unclassified Dyella]MBT2118788.1 DUF3301 domain-containing protein [Dyella sp. LX-1]MBT2141137.1 DUF3301 domain-containing protein [Dyella sp. LX-66]